MARVNDADCIAFVVQRFEYVVELDAGQGEEGIDAVGFDGFNQCLGAAHGGHGDQALSSIRGIVHPRMALRWT